MKKEKYIRLLCLAGFIGLLGIILGVITLINLSNVNSEITSLDETKLITISSSDTFTNTITKYKSTELESRDVSEYKATYELNGIYYLSTVDEWDKNTLRYLAGDLHSNKHGEEINYVYSVILYPSGDEPFMGAYKMQNENFDIPLSLYNFLPDDIMFDYSSKMGEISLYGADVKTTAQDMSMTLSHEYGHHFVEYYFGLENNENDRLTEYYRLRSQGTSDIRLEKESYEDYVENHKWFLAELAAEDYSYILGSKNATRTVEFDDAYDIIKYYAEHYGNSESPNAYVYEQCKNGMPHENLSLPLPHEVEGLYEYFYSFIEKDPPVFEEYENFDNIGSLNLTMKREAYGEHVFTWDQPYTDRRVLYTLIAYDQDDNVLFIQKTTRGNEEAWSTIGRTSYSYRGKGTLKHLIYRFTTPFDIDDGTPVRYRVSITLPDGRVAFSDPLDFEY